MGLNPGLPHCRWILYHLSYQGRPYIYDILLKSKLQGSSLVVLGLWASTAMAQVQSLVKELKIPAIQQGQKKEQNTGMKSENRSVVVGVKLGGNADKNTKHDEILEGDELFCVLIITVNTHFYTYIKTHTTVH